MASQMYPGSITLFESQYVQPFSLSFDPKIHTEKKIKLLYNLGYMIIWLLILDLCLI